MSNDPLIIKLDKLADLLRGLGLDPVDLGSIRSIHMQGDTIEVIRYRYDERGRMVVAGNTLLTETVLIRVEQA